MNTGIIGCGRVGYLFEFDKKRGQACTHIGAINKVKDLRLTACCDIDQSKLDIVKRDFPDINTYTDYNKMIDAEDLEIIVIASYTETHYDIACKAIEKARGLVIEKPLFSNTEQAIDIMERIKDKNIKIACNHHRRYSNRIKEVKKIIEDKRYGEVQTVSGNIFSMVPPELKKEIYTGGILYHDGTHMIDLMLYFFGEVEWFKAYGKRFNQESIESEAQVLLKYRDFDFINIINTRGGIRYFTFEFSIYFEKAVIVYRNPLFYLYELCDSRYFDGFYDIEETDLLKRMGDGNLFINMYKDLIRCIQEDKKPISSFEDGFYALMLIEDIYNNMTYR